MNLQFALTTPASKHLSVSDVIVTLLFVMALIGFSVSGVTTAQTTDARDAQISFRVSAPSTESPLSMERRVMELINRERQDNGVRPLVWIEKAAIVARFHSNNMAHSKFLGHRDLAGKMVSDRAERFGLSNWDQIGENIAWISGYEDPAVRAVFCWMRSPGHKRNIMDSKYSETGLGLAIGNDGKYYFTQVFVSPR